MFTGLVSGPKINYAGSIRGCLGGWIPSPVHAKSSLLLWSVCSHLTCKASCSDLYLQASKMHELA